MLSLFLRIFELQLSTVQLFEYNNNTSQYIQPVKKCTDFYVYEYDFNPILHWLFLTNRENALGRQNMC